MGVKKLNSWRIDRTTTQQCMGMGIYEWGEQATEMSTMDETGLDSGLEGRKSSFHIWPSQQPYSVWEMKWAFEDSSS